MTRMLLILATLLGFVGAAQAAGIIVPAEQRYSSYTAILPSCDDPGVLGRISDRFAQKESGYWHSALEIGGYDRVREIGFRSNGLAYIPRRYCVARAMLNDLREHTVVYQIQEDLGIIGWGYGVEWCVIGLDRNLAYAPACSALRPFLARFLGEQGLRLRY